MKRLAELSYPKVGEEVAKANTLVLLPVGSIEEHGPHLPLSVDAVLAEELAIKTAAHLEDDGYNVVLAPTIIYGVAKRAMDYPGNISIAPETLKALIKDVCRSLSLHGFKTFVIVNCHWDRGHEEALEKVMEELPRELGVKVLLFRFFRGGDIEIRKGLERFLNSPTPELDVHAGEWETSVFLYCRPKLVDQEKMKSLPAATSYDPEEFKLGKRSFKEMSVGGLGYFGTPSLASPDTGERLLNVRGKSLAEEVVRALKAR